MATRDILLQISDFVNKNTSSYQVTDISNDMTIREIIDTIKAKKNYTHPTESLVLYFARVECNHDAKLSTYNKSGRKNLKLELYLSNLITVHIQTLQSCGSGTTRCVPLWAICCTQTLKIEIADTCEVRVLKQKIFDLTDDSLAPSSDNIVLLHNKAPLNNFLTLKESEVVDGSKIKMFVPLCYFLKKHNPEDEEAKKKGEENGEQKDGKEEDKRDENESEMEVPKNGTIKA